MKNKLIWGHGRTYVCTYVRMYVHSFRRLLYVRAHSLIRWLRLPRRHQRLRHQRHRHHRLRRLRAGRSIAALPRRPFPRLLWVFRLGVNPLARVVRFGGFVLKRFRPLLGRELRKLRKLRRSRRSGPSSCSGCLATPTALWRILRAPSCGHMRSSSWRTRRLASA